MRLLESFLLCFPASFRARFGDEMREQLQLDLADARARGLGATTLYFVRTATGILVFGVAERLAPTWSELPRTASRTARRRRPVIDTLTRDMRHAARSLLRAPGFSLAVVATLGLAMGVVTGIYTVIDKVLLEPLPFEGTDRLVHIAGSAPGSDLPPEFRTSLEFYVHYKENAKGLEGLSTYNWFTSTIRVDERIERVRMASPTQGLFSTLGVDPILGRTPVPEDDDGVVVLSHDMWTNWFGADPGVLGRLVYVSGEDREVIGVMPEDFWFPQDGVQLWYPDVVRAEDLTPGRFGFFLVGRLAPGVTTEALREELQALALQLPDRFGGSARYREMIERHRPVVRPLEEELLGEIAQPLWMLLGAVGLVLLIACANVANLLLVRSERRQAELAIRKAIGATRVRLIIGQLTEAVILSMAGGVVAVLLAMMTVPLLVQSAPTRMPRISEVAVGPATLGYAFALALVTAMLCGLLPAVRGSVPSLTRLRETTRGGGSRQWGRSALVVAQTGLALVLLIGAGLLLRSVDKLRAVDPGFDARDVFSFQIAPEAPSLNDTATFAQFHLDFMDRLRALPGVETVGVVENLPLEEGTGQIRFQTDREVTEEGGGTLLNFTYTAGDYFEAMGIERVAGRDFTQAEQLESSGVVILSRSAADRLFPNGEALGQRIRSGDDPWQTVVAVVADVHQNGFADVAESTVYLPMSYGRPISSPAYVLRSSLAEDLTPPVRELVRQHAPNAPMYRVFTMEQLVSRSMLSLFFTMTTLGVAAALALTLGAIGLYGVLSYLVAERRREIGVRMAMGAEPRAVQWMVLRQGARVVGLGLVLGLAGAVFVTRGFASLLYGVSTHDPTTYAGMTALLVLIALIAVYLPARRASAVDPIRSLRSE